MDAQKIITARASVRVAASPDLRHPGTGATSNPSRTGFKIGDGLYDQNRKEGPSRWLSISLQKPDQDDRQRGEGERLHCLQGVPAAAVTAAVTEDRLPLVASVREHR